MVCQTCGTDYSGIYTPEVGHRVKAEQVVVGEVDDVTGTWVYVVDDTSDLARPLRRDRFTFERLPDPEPEWQGGDVVLDAKGWSFLRTAGGWSDFNGLRYADEEPARPLTLIARAGKPVTP